MSNRGSQWMPEIGEAWLHRHQAHNAADIIRRWRRVARAAGLRCRELCRAAGFPVLALDSPPPAAAEALYLSAGIHGDEAASALGLLVWAEANVARLSRAPVVILPLLNPAGLALNTRADADGIDLNRHFQMASHPVIAGWREFLAGRRLRLACCLHEDYDSRGTYCYELSRDASAAIAHRMLDATAELIPRDPRPVIEGRRADRAVIRRRRTPRLPGLPEAIVLYAEHAVATLTIESPSEYSLADRTRTHARWAEEAWRIAFG